MKNKAFTLAEIMVVLCVIGVIAAIVLPVAFKSSPDEDILKFKRANQNFYTAIRELINSEDYFAHGDLGKRATGILITGKNDGDELYMCEALAKVLNAKQQITIARIWPTVRRHNAFGTVSIFTNIRHNT